MDIVDAIIAIFGFGFAIFQFIKQNEENRNSTNEQNNKNWYLSVLVIPHLERINNFFEDLVRRLKDLKKRGNDGDLLVIAKEQLEQKESVTAFFSPLEAEIASYDIDLRNEISDLGLSLQDDLTNIIGDPSIDPSELERRVMEYKGKLIGLLYKPIHDTGPNK